MEQLLPLGKPFWKASGLPARWMQARGTGHTAGSFTRRSQSRAVTGFAVRLPSHAPLPGGAARRARLSAIPREPSTTLTLTPQAMLLALRRRLRLPLLLSPHRCGPNPGCGQEGDAVGTMRWPVLGQDCWLDGQKCSNGHGTAWLGQPSEPRPCRATMVRPHDGRKCASRPP